MLRRMLFALVAGLALAALTGPARAEDPAYKWSDLKARGSFGIEGGYAFHSGDAGNLPPVTKEWQAGVVAAYNIVPNLSATGYVVRGFDNETYRAAVGPRMTVWRSPDGKQAASVGAAYAWHAGDPKGLPRFPHEFEGQAVWGLALSPKLIAGASTSYGVDNRTFRSVLGLTYILGGAK